MKMDLFIAKQAVTASTDAKRQIWLRLSGCEETDLAQTEWYSTKRNWYTNDDGSVHC